MTKKFDIQFPLELPDGTTNADARLFVTEALMRLKRDSIAAHKGNKDLESIVLPRSNQIEIKS